MITIREYARPATLEEAWQLNQKRPNRVLGGMLWLKMEKISVGTAIDLSALGLDTIEETDTEFAIGAMATLRSLETHAALNAATNGAMREAVRHIVGVQFRNCATVGGSVYGRFGFSDVLTLLLALDCDVELYKAGRVPIAQFAALPYDRDILTHVYIKKTPGLAVHYQSVRATQTDFPILTCAAARTADGAYRFAIGARPMKAMLVCPTAAPDELPAAVQAAVPTGSNLRGSAAYRTHLVGVLVKRAVQALAKPGGALMQIHFTLNHKKTAAEIAPDTLLIDLVRSLGCKSVKRGCETANCGLCTVFLDEKPVLSCSVLAARVDGRSVTTLEGLQEEAAEFGAFIADQGAEQCGFCNPGFIMNALALFREKPDPNEEEIKEYLAGNLCRCSGYEGQLRGIQNFLAWKKSKEAAQ